MKAYIAAPYTQKSVDWGAGAYGKIKDIEYKEFLEMIDTVLKNSGYDTHLPHRDLNNWGEAYIEPEKLVQLCLSEIKAADVFVAYPENSAGVYIELGWANLLGKIIIIIAKKGEPQSSMILGLSGAKIITIENTDEIEEKLKNALKAIE